MSDVLRQGALGVSSYWHASWVLRGYDIPLVTPGLFCLGSLSWYKCKSLLMCLFAPFGCFKQNSLPSSK